MESQTPQPTQPTQTPQPTFDFNEVESSLEKAKQAGHFSIHISYHDENGTSCVHQNFINFLKTEFIEMSVNSYTKFCNKQKENSEQILNENLPETRPQTGFTSKQLS